MQLISTIVKRGTGLGEGCIFQVSDMHKQNLALMLSLGSIIAANMLLHLNLDCQLLASVFKIYSSDQLLWFPSCADI